MPVIGRLDGQVEEVLISPVSKGRREGERPTNPEGSPEPVGETPGGAPRAPSGTPHAGESSAEPDELPVWLL